MRYLNDGLLGQYLAAHELSEVDYDVDEQRVAELTEEVRAQHPGLTGEEVCAKALFRAIFERYGAPLPSSGNTKPAEVIAAKRMGEVHAAVKQSIPKIQEQLSELADKLEARKQQSEKQVNDFMEWLKKRDYDAAVERERQRIRERSQDVIVRIERERDRKKFRVALFVMLLLILIALLVPKAHGQIDVIKYQENGTTKATYAAPHTVNFTSGCTLTKTGAVIGIACSGGAGDNLGTAVAGDIVALFNGGTCSGYLKSNGTCDTPGGAGTVTHTGALTATHFVLGNGTDDITVSTITDNGTAVNASGYRIIAAEYDSDTINGATNGTIRLAKTDFLAWRNNANSANVSLSLDASDRVAATTFAGALVGNASTATALAADPTDCGAGSFTIGINASGTAQGCTDATTQAEFDARTITAGAGLSGGGTMASDRTIATASGEADFLASGALTCGASTQGKMQVHTTPLQYCDNAATPALQYAAYGDSSGKATTGDSATAFFTSGSLENTRGGTGTDSSGFTGVARVASGTWSAAELSGVVITSGSNATTPGKADVVQTNLYCSDAGASDTYACNLSPAITAYVAGTTYQFKANTANTGAASINFNSVGALTIKKLQGAITTDLSDNDIRVGQYVECVYDGTNCQMKSQLGNSPSASIIGTDTQVLYFDGANNPTGDADLAWDKTNNVLTVGSAATNYFTVTAASQSADRSLTFPDSAFTAGPIRTDSSGGVTYPGESGTGVFLRATSMPRFLRVTGSNYTNASNPAAFSDVTGLTTAVTNGDTISGFCQLIVESAATTTGVQLGINGPTASEARLEVNYYTGATAVSSFGVTTYDATSAATGTFPVASAGSALTLTQLSFHAVFTASGTFAIRGKNEVNSSTITIHKGSSCMVYGATG
jgi:hypothetical protein